MALTESFTMLLEDKKTKVEKSAEKFGVWPQLAKHALTIDPTPNGEYVPWVILQISKGNLIPPEDNEKVLGYLTRFHKLKKTQRFTGEKDINRYTTPGDLFQALQEAEGVVGKKEEVRVNEEKGVEHLGTKGSIDCYLVTTPEAAAKLFRNTEWCVRDPRAFVLEKYRPHRYFYFTRNNQPCMLYHPESEQHKNVADTQLPVIVALPFVVDFDLPKTFDIAISTGEPESFFAKTPDMAYKYASYSRQGVLPSPFPAGEAAIAQDGKIALKYAQKILKAPFPAGEEAIGQNLANALEYALFLKKPFPAGEKVIATDAESSYRYAAGAIGGPFPAGEKVIATDAEISLNYAYEVLGGPFPAGEEVISQDPSQACEYALFLEKPFPEGEKAIASFARTAYSYAREVLKGPFPAGEATIFKTHCFAKSYLKYLSSVGKKPAQPEIFKDQHPLLTTF